MSGAGGLFIVMGVSGSGKTTVAMALADAFDGVYLDADDFHPPANKKKMSSGIPLDDADRWPWLKILNRELARHAREHSGNPLFLACSALKRSYREYLAQGLSGLRFVYLKGSRELIAERMGRRAGHFMPASLIDSQFAALEEPDEAIVLDIERTVSEMVDGFRRDAF